MSGRTQKNARRGAVALGMLIVVALIVVIVLQVSSSSKSVTRTVIRTTAQTANRTGGQGTATRQKTTAAPTLATVGLQKVAGANGGPSGVPLPHGNLPGWKQVFRDDFPTSEDSPAEDFTGCVYGLTVRTSNCAGLPPAAAAKWFSYPDGEQPTSGTGVFEPSSVVSIAHHELTFDLHPDASTGQPLLAAMEAKLPVGTGSVKYAAMAVRFKAQAVSGYALSFELWPKDNQAALRGNMQFPAGDLNGKISSVTTLPTIPGDIAQASSQGYSSGWHTAVTEWRAGSVRYFLDGHLINELHRGLPSYPMNLILQIDGASATGDTGTGEIQVAWVSAYVPTG